MYGSIISAGCYIVRTFDFKPTLQFTRPIVKWLLGVWLTKKFFWYIFWRVQRATLIPMYLSWNPHMPRLAAWRRQFPSPVVASGHSLWHVPVSAHQLSLPDCSKLIRADNSIRSFSRKPLKSSVYLVRSGRVKVNCGVSTEQTTVMSWS